MKKCELCRGRATSYCEADRAYLCWDCDAKVHGANFLVARHERGLLCRACQSLTPWRACGSRWLGHAASLCHACVPPPPTTKDGGATPEALVVPLASLVPPPPRSEPSSPSSSSTSPSSPSSSSSSCSSSVGPSGEARGISLKRPRLGFSSRGLRCPPLRKGHKGSSTQGLKASTSEADEEKEEAAARKTDSSLKRRKNCGPHGLDRNGTG